MTATSAKNNPAEKRQVVPRPDGLAAGRAARGWPDDGFIFRQSRDADIEKAAEGESEENRKDGDDHGHWTSIEPAGLEAYNLVVAQKPHVRNELLRV